MTALPNAVEPALASAIRLCGGAGFETALFDLLRQATGADNLVVLAFPKGGPPRDLFHASRDPRVFSRVETAYLGGAYLLDPMYELQLNQAPSGAYRLLDIAPDAFHRTRYYEDYYRQTTILDEVTFLAYPRPGISIMLSLGRDAGSGRVFPAPAVEVCRRLAGSIVALAERPWSALPDQRADMPDVPARIVSALQSSRGIRLSPRQAEVALLILRGHSTASIALRLAISPQTVKVFRRQIYCRCEISSQAQLFALLMPLLAPGPGGER